MKELAAKYSGKIRYWEVLNEPNCFLSGAEYAKVLKNTAEAIRKQDSKAIIIGGSVVNAPRKDLYSATMSMEPTAFDAFSYHPYRFGLPNPENDGASFRQELRQTFDDLKINNHKPIVFLTEEGMGDGLDETRGIGYRLGYNGIIRGADWGEGEILQAQYLARMLATSLGEQVMGYCYHTLAGLTNDVLMNPQLPLKAIHTMHQKLGNSRSLGFLNLGRDFVGYLFEDMTNHTKSAVVWAKDAEYAGSQELGISPLGSCEVRDLFGRNLYDGGKTVKLGRELVYFTVRDREDAVVRNQIESIFRNFRSVPTANAQSVSR